MSGLPSLVTCSDGCWLRLFSEPVEDLPASGRMSQQFEMTDAGEDALSIQWQAACRVRTAAQRAVNRNQPVAEQV